MVPIRVLLADDHKLVRAGIRALLREIEGIEVVAEAANGREVLTLVKKFRPEVVLLDISMPDLNGLEAAARLTKANPEIRIIMLSGHSNEEYVAQALRAGAAGYLLKDAGTAELEVALRAVVKGETYLSPTVSKHVVTDYVRRLRGESGPLDMLTPRQREVLQLIAEGRTTKEIAGLLHLSPKTIETHRAQLMDRLETHDVPGLVRYAIRAGLIQAEA